MIISTSDNANKIRSELKVLGLNSRDVSVTLDRSTIEIRIKNPKVAYSIIEEIGKKYESVDRGQVTGDFVGNQYFVFFRIDDKAIDSLFTKHEATLMEAFEKAPTKDNGYNKIGELNAFIGCKGEGYAEIYGKDYCFTPSVIYKPKDMVSYLYRAGLV